MTRISHSQQITRRDCQVLVVGAGPTGLVLACELLARGIRARIIDKGDGVLLQTRALGVHARTLEVFDMMGLAERFVEQGQVVRRFHMYTEGKTLVRLDLARNGSAFGFMLDVPQDVTETILRQRVAELGGSVESGTELRSLSQDPGGVTVTVIEPGEQCARSRPAMLSAPMARIAASAANSAWTSTGTRMRRTGCSPMSTWAGTVPTTRCTRSSGAMAAADLHADARAPLAGDPPLRRRA